MGTGLIFSREIQVDIRLLIAFKAEEGLKWYIMSFLDQLMPAVRTVTVRKIAAGITGKCQNLWRVKVNKMALRTNIMRG